MEVLGSPGPDWGSTVHGEPYLYSPTADGCLQRTEDTNKYHNYIIISIIIILLLICVILMLLLSLLLLLLYYCWYALLLCYCYITITIVIIIIIFYYCYHIIIVVVVIIILFNFCEVLYRLKVQNWRYFIFNRSNQTWLKTSSTYWLLVIIDHRDALLIDYQLIYFPSLRTRCHGNAFRSKVSWQGNVLS